MHQVMFRDGKIEWVTVEVLRDLQGKCEALFVIEEKDGCLDGYFDPIRLPIPD